MEGLVGFARRNYMVPVPEAKNLECLNKKLLQDCQAYGHHRIQGKESSVNEMYEHEKPHLLSLPEIEFSNIQTFNGKADKYSTIILDKNRYSVPTEYAYLRLRGVLSVNMVVLYYGNKKIAEHSRLYDVNKWSLDPYHYLELIRQRPLSFESARPIKQWRKTWSSDYEELLIRFCNSKGKTNGTKDFIQVLLLHKEYKAHIVQIAIKKALRANVSCSDAVLQILMNSLEESKSFNCLPSWNVLPAPDISIYDKIRGGI